MANKKISQLNAVTTLSNNDTFPVVQGTETKKAKISDVKSYLPTASSLTTGLLSNTDWTTFNNKQSALTLGNLTESTSSVLTITGGTGSVIGSGLSIQVKQASGSQSGYLSSSDWTTFNNKLNSLTLTTTGTSGAATLVGSTLNIPQYLGTALTSLGGQTGATQTFSTDNTGTDFAITSATNNHKFSIPNASASARGLLTSTDWSTFNSKEPAVTKGNLTESTSSVLTITGGTGSVIGSGTTIQVKQANGSQSGFLSSGDWTTFNGKQGALTLTTTGSSGAATLVNNVLNIPQYSGGGGSMSIGGSITSATSGSVLFAGTSGVLSQDNSNFFWDNTNKRLGIATASPTHKLHVSGSTTASSGSAIGAQFTPTLVAAANSDVLTALNISPTFTNGAFTGLSNIGLRINNAFTFGVNASSGSGEIKSLATNVDFLGITGNTGTFNFYGGGAYNTGAGVTVGGNSHATYANVIAFWRSGFIQNARFTTNGNLILGTGTADGGFKLDNSGTTRLQGNVTISDAINITVGSTTGTKIGLSSTEKLGFWNVTPVVQPTTATTAAARIGGAGTTITDTDTFDGYTIAKVVKALRNVGILQ